MKYTVLNTCFKAIASGPLWAMLIGEKHEEWGPRPSREFVVFCCTGRKRDIREEISKAWGYSVGESLSEYRAYCVVRVGKDCTATDGKTGWEIEDAVHLTDESGADGIFLPGGPATSRPKQGPMMPHSIAHHAVLAICNNLVK